MTTDRGARPLPPMLLLAQHSPITGFDLVFARRPVVLSVLALVLIALVVGAYPWRRHR